MQAGGRRFDPDWLHQPWFLRMRVKRHMRRVRCMCGFASLAEMLERLFFKNSEVVLTHQIQRNLDGFKRKFEYERVQMNHVAFENQQRIAPGSLGLYGQVNKRMWWMPRR